MDAIKAGTRSLEAAFLMTGFGLHEHRESIEVGKITLNPDLVATNTGRTLRTPLDKSNYLKNLLYKRPDQGDLDSSLDFSRNNNIKIVDNSNQGGALRSVNPRAHSYAKEVDFIRPRQSTKMMLQ